mmetsp:Transcript_1325/g.3089  ORF Transcript_1325/g.3089 Transcript_1325/m.3089 type:complete len:526 (+) Transcript_1325:108-1685(+)
MSSEPVFTESTKHFIREFNRAIQRNDINHVGKLYEYEFGNHTNKFFKISAWPSAEVVADLINQNGNERERENFLVLYKQLYYRHLLMKKLNSGIEAYFESFHNFIDLFNTLLGLRTEAPEFEIPASWCWDMIDEFTYQFSAFHIARHRVADLTQQEKTELDKDPHKWSALTVENFLVGENSFADKAMVRMSPQEREKKFLEGVGVPHILFETLGVYALIGMLRVYTMTGDYTSGIDLIKCIDLNGNHENVCVPAAYTTLHYYLSFCYLSTRRYEECVRTATDGLIYLQRNRALLPRTYQKGNIEKMQEQMFGILAIATSLVPQRISESLAGDMRNRFGDQIRRMRKMEKDAFKEVYNAVVPKFIPMKTLSGGFDTKSNPDEGLQLQTKVFMEEIESMSKVPDIYSYLKMCTAIHVDKLKNFLKESGDLTPKLLYLKHKTRSGSKYTGANNQEPIEDEKKRPKDQAEVKENKAIPKAQDIQFFVSDDMVHVNETRQRKQHADFFIREVLRYENIIRKVDKVGGGMY